MEFYETTAVLGDTPIDAIEPVEPPREAGPGWGLRERIAIGKLAVFRWVREEECQQEERSNAR